VEGVSCGGTGIGGGGALVSKIHAGTSPDASWATAHPLTLQDPSTLQDRWRRLDDFSLDASPDQVFKVGFLIFSPGIVPLRCVILVMIWFT